MTKTETTTQSIPEYFYDDLRPKGAIGNQCSTNLSAKEYDLSYSYDADGLRVSRTDNVSGLTTYYVWDTENPTGYPQVIEEIENNQVVRRYGYGLFLENVDIWNGTSFDRFYVVRDGTNSVRMLLDSAGNVAAEYDYDAFGNILNTTINTPICSQNAFGFHSEFRDPVTGLVYLRARWYDVEKGRFLRADSYEGENNRPTSLNKYVFGNNNPIMYTDGTGEFAESVEGTGNISGERISELLAGIANKTFLLADENTDLGLVERLFLAEIVDPMGMKIKKNKTEMEIVRYNEQEAKRTAMLLGSVIINRKIDANYSKTTVEIIREKGQFAGFDIEGEIGDVQQANIDDKISWANKNSRFKIAYRKYLDMIANYSAQTMDNVIEDPYKGKTFYVRTKYSGSPATGAVELETIEGQTFWRRGN